MAEVADDKFLDVFNTIQNSLNSQTEFLRSIYNIETKRFNFEREQAKDAAREKALKVEESKKQEQTNSTTTTETQSRSERGGLNLAGLGAGLGGLLGGALGAITPAVLGRLLIRGPMLGLMAPVVGEFVSGAVEEALGNFNPGGEASGFNTSVADAIGNSVTYGMIGLIFGRTIGRVFAGAGFLSSFSDELFNRLDADNDELIRVFGMELDAVDMSAILSVIGGAVALALPSLIRRGLLPALSALLLGTAASGGGAPTTPTRPNPANRATSPEALRQAGEINERRNLLRNRIAQMTPEEIGELRQRDLMIDREGMLRRTNGQFLPENEMRGLLDEFEARRIRTPGALGRILRGVGRASAVVPFVTAALDEQAQETDMNYLATVAKEFALGIPAIIDLASMIGAGGTNMLLGTELEGTDLYETLNNALFDIRRQNIERFGAAVGTDEAEVIAQALLDRMREGERLSDEEQAQFMTLRTPMQMEEYDRIRRRRQEEEFMRQLEMEERMQTALEAQASTGGRGLSVGPTPQEIREYEALRLDALVEAERLNQADALEREQSMRELEKYLSSINGGSVLLNNGGNTIRQGDNISSNTVTIIAPKDSSSSLSNSGVMTAFQ